ncbi:MAG: hypothetical protein DRP46_06855 [Candidatus Zixiibacteriota bacterium]|nr:MAG: hypothetical protein DRP46_06855 [candidate division Zixibacteria bacterium]
MKKKYGKKKSHRTRDWLKFFTGLIMLAVFFGFFASGYSPPGVLGKVLRHNQANDIDASPLLYMEVEHMSELEEGVRLMREKAQRRTGDTVRSLL